MSLAPRPPARVEAKISVRPSWESVGWVSPAVVFSGAPRFTGGDQGSCTLRRVDVHRSFPPEPPARLEYRNTSRPSTRTDGWASVIARSEEHTSELQSLAYLVCRLLLEKKKKKQKTSDYSK